MCIVKKPKIPATTAADDKPLPVLRNPILDGMLGNIAALRQGTNAFRIDLVNPLTIPAGGNPGTGGAGGGSGGGSGGSSSGGSTSSTSSSGGSTGTKSGLSGGGGGRFTDKF